MKILVTGVTGFVGQSLIRELKLKNINFVGIVRKLSLSNLDEMIEVSDFSIPDIWQEPLKDCAVVVHLVARVHVMHEEALSPLAEFRKVNVDATLFIAQQAAKAGVKRFIFISSIKVNGEHTEIGRPFTEVDGANPQDAYGLSKLEAEQGLMQIAQQTGMELVIIRPPLVYGAGVKANFASMLRTVKRGVPLPFGAIHNRRSFVYVGNLVSLILRCLDHPAAANQVFLVSDGRDLSTTELLLQSAMALGVKSKLLPVPQSLIAIGATLLGKQAVAQRLCGNLQIDISKARTLLAWAPPVSVTDGLKATALGLI